MLMHVVCFKYNPGIDEAAREAHRAQLRALSDVEGVEDLLVGADVVRSARSYDTALVARFRDWAALEAYQKHPRHVPVAQHGVAISAHIVAVDFQL
ncbi:MAG: Dabb family protein [Betaproteobacteria bacterium]